MSNPLIEVDVTADLPSEPYPGLRPFEQDEWAIFFGREVMTDDVIDRLSKHHLIAVHGASGCGKSSLIRAGVFPSLSIEHARNGRRWRKAIIRPSGGPLRNLAMALAKVLACPPPKMEATENLNLISAWHDRLAFGRSVLDDIEAALEQTGGGSLCILVDQFEELFRWAKDVSREKAQLFIEILQGAAAPDGTAAQNVFLILTLRSDYLGECARFDGFAETVNRCQYLLPRMDNFALLRAIHEPGQLFGGTVEATVGDRLIGMARRGEDALPILQHTLMRAFRRARRRSGGTGRWTVTLEDFDNVWGREGALSQHAEKVLTALCKRDHHLKSATEWVFRSLIDQDSEGRGIRRPRRFGELVAVAGMDRIKVAQVVEAFSAPGCNFLVLQPPEPLTDDTEVDISHEALIRSWRRISDPKPDAKSGKPRGWMHREFQDGLIWRALAVQAQAFIRDQSACLDPGTTAQWWAWYEDIGKRRAWAARYCIRQNDTGARLKGSGHSKEDAEWADVEKLMAASYDRWQEEKAKLGFAQKAVKRIKFLA
nr:hypothetical protein [uncultured Azospirillum sp.]